MSIRTELSKKKDPGIGRLCIVGTEEVGKTLAFSAVCDHIPHRDDDHILCSFCLTSAGSQQ